MTVQRFGDDADTFRYDPIYRNAAALCILQIGELVGNLSEEFREQHTEIPWRQIKAMWNIVAHSYGTVNPEIIGRSYRMIFRCCGSIVLMFLRKNRNVRRYMSHAL